MFGKPDPQALRYLGLGRDSSRSSGSRKKYIGWLVLFEDRSTGTQHRWYRARTRADAEDAVRRLNQQHFPQRLYWCEWWSTSSSIEGFS